MSIVSIQDTSRQHSFNVKMSILELDFAKTADFTPKTTATKVSQNFRNKNAYV